MTKRAQFMRWFIPAALIFLLGFTAATLWDLDINLALYSRYNFFAIFMEAFGWYTAFVPPLLLALLVATTPRGSLPVRRRILAFTVSLVGFGAIYFKSGGYLYDRGLLESSGAFVTWLVAGGVFALLCLLAVMRVPQRLREKLFFFSLAGSVFCVAIQAIASGTKLIWQRTRFDDMVYSGSFADFTPWYRPFGNGGSSFPSGHTANAAGIFVLLILCDLFTSLNRRKRFITFICWAYVALMAFSRILIGRHFLSDTLAASALIALVFYLLHHTQLYRKNLTTVLKNSAKPAASVAVPPPKGKHR